MCRGVVLRGGRQTFSGNGMRSISTTLLSASGSAEAELSCFIRLASVGEGASSDALRLTGSGAKQRVSVCFRSIGRWRGGEPTVLGRHGDSANLVDEGGEAVARGGMIDGVHRRLGTRRRPCRLEPPMLRRFDGGDGTPRCLGLLGRMTRVKKVNTKIRRGR